jgi:hypothetical protein
MVGFVCLGSDSLLWWHCGTADEAKATAAGPPAEPSTGAGAWELLVAAAKHLSTVWLNYRARGARFQHDWETAERQRV